MNKRRLGTIWEKAAKEYLIRHGYQILRINYRCRLGEIDIIAKESGTLVFIEVKYRKTSDYGSSLEAVDFKKQNIIRRVAQYYLITVMHTENLPCRFDVLGIDSGNITLIKNAF